MKFQKINKVGEGRVLFLGGRDRRLKSDLKIKDRKH